MRSEGVKELIGRDWDKTLSVSDTRMATAQVRMLTAEYKPMVGLTWSQVNKVATGITILVKGGTIGSPIFECCDGHIACYFRPPSLHHNVCKTSHLLRGR
jgi:hypothetical protein